MNIWQRTVEEQDAEIVRAKAEMKERCAQRAIDWRGWSSGNREPTPEEIAAAIRAMKEDH